MADKYSADDLWSLDDIIPKRKYVRPKPSDVSTVEIEFGQDVKKPDTENLDRAKKALLEASAKFGAKKAEIVGDRIKNISLEEDVQTASEPPTVYADINDIIKSVSVKRWENRYQFHTRFVLSARKYVSAQAEKTHFVPFYSTVPNYGQLSREQFDYYIYWRNELKKDVILETSPGYLSLLFFEILNLPEFYPPEEGRRLIANMWRCRALSQRIPSSPYLEWFIDYLAVNNLTVPDCIRIQVPSGGRYVYLSRNGESEALAKYICSVSDSFDLKSSVISEENRALFEKNIYPSVLCAVKEGLKNKYPPFDMTNMIFTEKITEWPAFSGAICTWENKRTVTMEHTEVLGSFYLTSLVSDLRKYSENLIRKHLGIRSRYHVKELSQGYRDCINHYYGRVGLNSSKPKEPEKNNYDYLYEADSAPISFSAALKIEKNAWTTTDLLTDNGEFENETVTEAQPLPEDGEKRLAVKTVKTLLSGGDCGKIATEGNLFPETLYERVNEYLYDVFGDNVIENGNIDCYADELREWLSQQ